MKNVNLYFKKHASSIRESSTMKNAESFHFTLTPYGETPYIDSIIKTP